MQPECETPITQTPFNFTNYKTARKNNTMAWPYYSNWFSRSTHTSSNSAKLWKCNGR